MFVLTFMSLIIDSEYENRLKERFYIVVLTHQTALLPGTSLSVDMHFEIIVELICMCTCFVLFLLNMIGHMKNRENTISNDFKIAKTTQKLKATKTKQPKLYLYEQNTWEMAVIEPKTVDIRNRDCTG